MLSGSPISQRRHVALTSFWLNRFTTVVILALIVALRVCDGQFMSRQIIWSCSSGGRWSHRSDDLPAHSSFSRLFHSFRIACLKCFFMMRGLSDLKMSSIEPMSYMSRVSCAFIAQLFRTLRAHWRLSRISRLLFLLMAILHKSVRIAMCSRAGRGSWFAMRYAAALYASGWQAVQLLDDGHVEGC